MRKITTWQCDYCRCQGNKEKIQDHEKSCINNPKLRACSSCKNEDVEWWDGNPWFSCKIKKEHSNYEIDGKCPEHIPKVSN